MRPAADCARTMSSWSYVRPDSALTNWIAPIVRRFVFKGTVMTLVSWSFSASSRISGRLVRDAALFDGEIERPRE